jgi:hypothetical protein
VHKLQVLKNVNLSEYIYREFRLLGGKMPENVFVREFFGFVAVLGYFIGGAWFLRKKWLRHFYEKMGGARFYILSFLFLTMAALPIKMILRWTINLKYIIAIPEAFFNI